MEAEEIKRWNFSLLFYIYINLQQHYHHLVTSMHSSVCLGLERIRSITSNAAVTDPYQVVLCSFITWHEVVYFWIDADLLTAWGGKERKNRWRKRTSLLSPFHVSSASRSDTNLRWALNSNVNRQRPFAGKTNVLNWLNLILTTCDKSTIKILNLSPCFNLWCLIICHHISQFAVMSPFFSLLRLPAFAANVHECLVRFQFWLWCLSLRRATVGMLSAARNQDMWEEDNRPWEGEALSHFPALMSENQFRVSEAWSWRRTLRHSGIVRAARSARRKSAYMIRICLWTPQGGNKILRETWWGLFSQH